jgi:hypothetical protein
MNCLSVIVTNLTKGLDVSVTDMSYHPVAYCSPVCGIDLAWDGVADTSGIALLDANGEELLVKID